MTRAPAWIIAPDTLSCFPGKVKNNRQPPPPAPQAGLKAALYMFVNGRVDDCPTRTLGEYTDVGPRACKVDAHGHSAADDHECSSTVNPGEGVG
jgi:hypothetical protein